MNTFGQVTSYLDIVGVGFPKEGGAFPSGATALQMGVAQNRWSVRYFIAANTLI